MTTWQIFCEALKWIVGIGCAWLLLQFLWLIICQLIARWLGFK